MSDPNIKQIKIVGAGAESLDGGTRKKGIRGSRSKTQKLKVGMEGAGSTSPGTLVQLTASHIPGESSAPAPVGVDSKLTESGAPLQIAAAQGGAKADVKVVLEAAKKKKGKLILAAARPPVKTRKILKTKKVRVTISNLGKKIKRAKDIRKAATESSLEHIKKELSKAGLIKADSKAPEEILRQMYADFETLKGRAL
jgi:hypothetical protein